MDIHQLQIFVNVAECKGFLAASKKMHLSQSTVSTHVSALEHELGKKLIRRTARKFELTEDGVKLYKYAVDILLLHRKAIVVCTCNIEWLFKEKCKYAGGDDECG